jgi:hypothetical protein
MYLVLVKGGFTSGFASAAGPLAFISSSMSSDDVGEEGVVSVLAAAIFLFVLEALIASSLSLSLRFKASSVNLVSVCGLDSMLHGIFWLIIVLFASFFRSFSTL